MQLPPKAKGPNAEIHLDVHDGSKIFAGKKLKGDLKVEINSLMDDCKIELSFICKEWCWIEGGAALQPGGPPQPPREDSSDIMPPDVRVLMDHGTPHPGDKVKFDFEYHIPDNAPAAFEIDTSGAKGYIRYLLMVKVSAKGLPDVISWKKIGVREHFAKAEKVHRESEGSVTGYCYADKGKLKLRYDMPPLADLTKISGVFEGMLVVDNRGCEFPIKQFSARLGYTVSMNAKDKHTSRGGNIMAWTFNGVPGKEERTIPVQQTIPRKDEFKLLCTSSKGKLLKRSYAFNLVPVYDTFTCSVPTVNVVFELEHLKTYKKKEDKH